MDASVGCEIDSVEMDAQARRAASHMVKARARQLARRPLALEALHPGLSVAPPRTLVAVAAHLVEREQRSPRRWFGFGGEVNLLSARAALLLGRAQRRCTSRHCPASRVPKGACEAENPGRPADEPVAVRSGPRSPRPASPAS